MSRVFADSHSFTPYSKMPLFRSKSKTVYFGNDLKAGSYKVSGILQKGMGLLDGLLGSGLGKPLVAKVTTMDADLESIPIEPDCTGRTLFDQVCRIIGLREFWYFGLQYINKKGIPCWLQMDKKVRKQDIPRETEGHISLLFLVKFYPEDVEEELIQDLTKHLFFLQIKQAILTQQLYCSAEAAVLLASYAVQAMYGDCSDETELDISKNLPANVTSQYDMTADMWHERIRRWWTHNAGQSREDAEMEYLRVAQDLEMYGIQYFGIQNKKETDLMLGVSAQGVGIYKGGNMITPRPFFSWSEIRNISFKNKKFNMKTVDKSTITFQAQDHSINMSILELCIGTHNLYLRRRQSDTLEVQQMKVQAKEERIRKQEEQDRLKRERLDRIQAESERNQLRMELQTVADQLRAAQEQIRKAGEKVELSSMKAQKADEELRAFSKRAEDAERDAQQVRITYEKCNKERRKLEEHLKEKEMHIQRLSKSIGELNRVHRNPQYSSQNILTQDVQRNGWIPNGSDGGVGGMSLSNHELGMSSSSAEDDLDGDRQRASNWRQWEEMQRVHRANSSQPMMMQGQGGQPHNHHVPLSPPYGGRNNMHPPGMVQLPPPPPQTAQASHNIGLSAPPDPSTFSKASLPNEISQMCKNLEMSKNDYNERSRHFKESLEEFRTELEGLKREDRFLTAMDRAFIANEGRDKTDTLRMSSKGSAKRRVETFDEL